MVVLAAILFNKSGPAQSLQASLGDLQARRPRFINSRNVFLTCCPAIRLAIKPILRADCKVLNRMASKTDPAKEIAAICKALSTATSVSGEKFMSELFEFEPSSTNFFRVVSTIMRRIDQVDKIVRQSDLEEDHIELASEVLLDFRSIFRISTLGSAWNNSASGAAIAKKNHTGLSLLSSTVKKYRSYPILDDAEKEYAIGTIEDYLTHLDRSHDPDIFTIQSAVKDGLEEYVFCLRNIKWFGAEYAIGSLNKVNAAYLAIERGIPSDNMEIIEDFQSLKRILSFVNGKLSEVREYSDNAKMLWDIYSSSAPLLIPVIGVAKLIAKKSS